MASVAPKLILDNRVNVSDSFDQLVKYSGVNVNYFEIQPDGSNFPTQVLYNNIVVPNLSTTLVSRNLRHHFDVVITYPIADANKPQLPGVKDDGVAVAVGSPLLPVDTVLRGAAPLQMNCTSTSLTINSGTNTINSQQVLDPIMRRLPKKYMMDDASEAPSQLDNNWVLTTDAGRYIGQAGLAVPAGANWAAITGAAPIVIAVGGVNVSYVPLGFAPPAVGTVLQLTCPPGYQAFCVVNTLWVPAGATIGQIKLYQTQTGASARSNQPTSDYLNCQGGFSRASFLPSSASVAGGVVTVRYNITEQLYLSPCTLWSNENFLANINTLSLLFNYGSLANMLVSANPASVISSVAIQNPRLSLTYIQINPEVMSIPRSVSYNFENIVYFSKTVAWTSPNQQLQSDTIRLQAMPAMIYVLARQPMSAQTIGSTNTFLQLGQGGSAQNTPAGVAINIGNRTGLGASASDATWWRIAKRNGWSASYNEYLRASSCLCFSPVEDLGVDPSLDSLPMTTGSVNFQISAYFNDQNVQYASGAAYAGNVELLIVAVYAGVATITTDQIMYNLGALSANEVNATLASAGKQGSTYSSEHVQPSIEGKGLAAPGKYVLSGMASKHQRSKLMM